MEDNDGIVTDVVELALDLDLLEAQIDCIAELGLNADKEAEDLLGGVLNLLVYLRETFGAEEN